MRQHGRSSNAPRRVGIDIPALRTLLATALVCVLALGVAWTTRDPPAVDPRPFLLNALLAPALDADALPLRWVDPRPALGCGSATTVYVNGQPLAAGALVPDTPFALEWHADHCSPFGRTGPRLEGSVLLTVFREDWGFSALVEPTDLRFERLGRKSIVAAHGAVTMPRSVDADDPAEAAPDEMQDDTKEIHR